MTGWKDWAVGEVVTEADFQGFVQDQVVQVYADDSERTTALGANVTEGMFSYLTSTGSTEVYDGSDWVSVSSGGTGDITSVTAGTALTGGGTSGDVTLNVDLAEVSKATLVTDATTARTITSTDASKTILLTSGSATTITVNASTDFEVGARVDLIADGAGEVTVTADTATVAGAGTSTTSGSFTIGGQYSAATLLCVATDEYRLIGNIGVV